MPPAAIRVEVEGPAALFDSERTASYPHTGRMLNEGIAEFLESSVREHARAPAVSVEVTVHGPPISPEAEESVRRDFHHYYDCEKVLAQLDQRVNRVEGVGSFRHTAWMLLGAGIIALVVYIVVAVLPPQTLLVAFLTAFLYIATITVVWVLFWDPFEKVVFDGYMLRAHTLAVEKLSRSTLRFTYSGGTSPA